MPAAASNSANTSKKRGTDTKPTGGKTSTSKSTTNKKSAASKDATTKAAVTKSTAKSATKKTTTKKTTTKATTKTAPKTTTKKAESTKATDKKRKAEEEEEDDGEKEPARPTKKSKPTVKAPPKKPAAPKVKPEPKRPKLRRAKVINEPPTAVLKVFVFGEGSSGELGLGSAGNVRDVKRPRLNPLLAPEKVGVVQLAAGGMHVAALTKDGTILTWGVNDQGALGRDTSSGEVFVEKKHLPNGDDKKEDDDKSDSDSELDALNEAESTPAPISLANVPEDTVFTSIAASDSCTFAVTDDGKVFGCGTFRNNEGILGFSKTIEVQKILTHIPELKKIKKVVCGANHAIAINEAGTLFSWGAGQQNQLGRRLVERMKYYGLMPGEFGLPKGKFTSIGAGAYNSFALAKDGRVFAWGLNSYGELGIADGVGDEDGESCLMPAEVEALSHKGVTQISSGAHHTLAVCANGALLGVGRVDGFQLADDGASFPEQDTIKDARDKVRILKVPRQIPGLPKDVVYASAGPDHSLAITKLGKAYTWGFSVNYQTAQGTEDDVEEATLVDNTATREEKLVWCGAGGQYGVFASEWKG